MTVLRQVSRVARRLSRRRCWACNLLVHPGDRYVEQSNADGGRVFTVIAHAQCDDECAGGEMLDYGWLASDPSVGSEAWQLWYHRRAGLWHMARDMAFLFAQRVRVAMGRGAVPEALGDLAATYSPRRYSPTCDQKD